MLRSVSEALDLVVKAVVPIEPVETPLESSLGLTLAQEIISQVESPPFDKSAMDGYAVRTRDVKNAGVQLKVVEELSAGVVPARTVGEGEASRIMTGAQIPAGADAIVRIEDTALSGSIVTIQIGEVPPGQNIIPRASCLASGVKVFSCGDRIQPAQLAALAELGCASIQAFPPPRVAILATGDELVPVGANPKPGQIRNTNESMLTAQVRALGGVPIPLGIAKDNRPSLREKISLGLTADILVLSGGVSAGKLDLVPLMLSELGCEELFHKVNMKPGKPVWFGQRITKTDRCYIFGLPGNPVSSMVCAELFLRTALRCLAKWRDPYPIFQLATLTKQFRQKGDRPTYHPARIDFNATGISVTPISWQGSSDIQATIHANGMAYFPTEGDYNANSQIQVMKWAAVE